jgi:septum formation inhibitor-activating ATPase MinD
MSLFTPEDLLLYLYKETSAEQNCAIEEALAQDWTLREKLAVLQASQSRLNTIVETPRTQTVLNILKYAALTQRVSQ